METPRCRLCYAALPESESLVETGIDGEKVWWCLNIIPCLRRAGYHSIANILEPSYDTDIPNERARNRLATQGEIPIPGRMQLPGMDINSKNRRGGGIRGISYARNVFRRQSKEGKQ